MRTSTCTVLALTACLATLPTLSALAEDTRSDSAIFLKGTFRFSMAKTCTDNTTGSTAHFYINGTIVYDGQGSGQLAQQGTLVIPSPTSTSFEETAELTYTVKPNGSFSQEGTFHAVDRSYTLTGAKMNGHIDPHGSVLIFSATIPPEKETVTMPGRGSSEYLCGASGTAVRIR
ncbi:MAG: hypothetical protein HOO98_12270 [Nitrospira sp.]|nr:hypothetical protein [Nitrospira sp.]